MTARDDGRAAAQALFRTNALPADSINLIADAVMDAYSPGHRAEVLAEAVGLIAAARAASGAMHPCDLAYINRRVGMREAMAVLRREYEPAPEPSRRPHVRRGRKAAS